MDATELAYAGAAEQARLIAAGEVSAREVVGAVLRRIERLDPQLNAFRVVLAERALMMWPWTESVSFGATRNPWALDRTPGGSSGGSGAAVAAGLCGVALGTDGAGSIRIPAAYCGLFGMKPQHGRVPLAPGTSDGWHGMNHVGPLARTVADAALFLDAVADGAPEGGFTAAAARAPARLRIAVSTKVPPGIVVRVGAERRAAASPPA